MDRFRINSGTYANLRSKVNSQKNMKLKHIAKQDPHGETLFEFEEQLVLFYPFPHLDMNFLYRSVDR